MYGPYNQSDMAAHIPIQVVKEHTHDQSCGKSISGRPNGEVRREMPNDWVETKEQKPLDWRDLAKIAIFVARCQARYDGRLTRQFLFTLGTSVYRLLTIQRVT